MAALPITAEQFAAAEAARAEMVQVWENGTSGGGVIPAICGPGEYDLFPTNPLPRNHAEAIAVALVRAQPSPLPGAWQAVSSFLHGWVSDGAPWRPVSYRKDTAGRVTLAGILMSGTPATSAFVLPAGYRPAYPLTVAAISSDEIGEVRVWSDGAVTPYIVGTTGWISLDGISFYVD